MFSSVQSVTLEGLRPLKLRVEVDITGQALPSFNIVGLPDAAVSESKDDFRTQFCISLAQSLKTHGHKDPISIVEPLLKNSAGYTNDNSKQRALKELETIRSMLGER